MSLETKIAKWRATTQNVWRVEHPKVANAIVALVEVVRSNHRLLFKVGSVLVKLLRTRLDGDELLKRCKGLQREKNDLTNKVERTTTEKDELAMVVADLLAQLKESKSRLEEFELRASKEREASKKLEEELLVYKKKVMEKHEKGFHKAVRQVGFFAKDLDLSLSDPFKDVKDGILLDENELAAKEEAADEEQEAEEYGDDA